MSQIQDIGCIHYHLDRKPITIQHIDGAILSKAPFCSDCISFYKSCTTFKIIDKSPLKNLEHL